MLKLYQLLLKFSIFRHLSDFNKRLRKISKFSNKNKLYPEDVILRLSKVVSGTYRNT